VAAAGIVAAAPAAAHDFADADFSAISNAIVAKEAFGDAGYDGGYNSLAFDLGGAWDGGFQATFSGLSSSSYTAIAASNIGELNVNLSLGSGPNALLEATDFGAILQMPAPAMAMDVAMPSFDMLMPQGAGLEGQMTGSVAQIIADALQGGGSAPSIDTLLSALPGAGLGENVGLQGLATPVGGNVSTWDMGHGGVFTFDAASIITSEAMVLHHDAVQPVANG